MSRLLSYSRSQYRHLRKSITIFLLSAISVLATALSPQPTRADNTYLGLCPSGTFTQNWSNTGLITVDDNWGSVPSVVGYRGDGMVSTTGVDPQTVLADGSTTPVDVNANQVNPNTFTAGGVTEFDGIADPVVAFQGSGTGRAPHIVLHLNTTDASNIQISFDARDLDGSTDNSIQPIAVHYRVGATGSYTNVPDAFIGDASSGPSLATLVTHRDVTLPAAINNQSQVQLRFMTTDAVGSDEWIGIDNINITATCGNVNTPTATSAPTVTPTPSPAVITQVHDIQGAGSAVTGAGPFTVEAVVVGDYQPTLSGFFIQEEDADVDADPATSEGILVFCGTTCPVDVAVGDQVRVTGSATEFNGMSELSATTASSVSILSHSNSLPTPATITLPVPATFTKDQYYEQFEGMLVTIPETMTVTEIFQLGRFGQVTLAQGGKNEQYTVNNVPSTSGYTAYLDQLARRDIILDDTNNLQNADPIFHPQPGLTASNSLRGGSTITGLTGILHWSWGGNAASPEAWRIRPVSPQYLYNFNLAARPTPPAVSGTLKVASFNVLNFFNGDGMGGGFPTPRGAENINEFNRQYPKTVSAICGLNADIAGLMEMENDASGSTSALDFLVSQVNASCGRSNPYVYIDTNILGTDQIRVAMMYRSGVVTPIGAFLTDTDPINNRPPLAQTFEQVSTGARFTVIVNHLKSKGCDAAAVGGDANNGDGQGCYADRRTQQAARLLAFINNVVIPAAGDPDVLLIGDFNSYASEPPITTITGHGFTDTIGAGSAYSYVFDGQWGYLDHALASNSLVGQVAGVGDWHINSDEPSVLDYNTNFKTAGQQASLYAPDAFRSSDHDPVLVGLNLSIPPTDTPTPTATDTPTATPTNTPTATFTDTATDTTTPTQTDTSTATFTPTNTATPTNTVSIPTNTATPTNTAIGPTPLPTNKPGIIRPRLKLEAECSPQPALYRVWRVENKGDKSVTFDWILLRTQQAGSRNIGAHGALFLQTVTTQLPFEYMSIWVNGELHDIALGTDKKCK